VDRLGWAAGLSFVSFGLHIGIRANQPSIMPALTDYLPPGWKPAESSVVDSLYSLRVGDEAGRQRARQYHLLYIGGERVARSLDLEEVLFTLETYVQLTVAAQAQHRVFVHAGVVGWRGQAIVIPGRSNSGKSTLVAALLRAGATYYSDEYAVLDARGRVYPYPRPLALSESPGEPPTRWPAKALGSRTGVKPLPVGLVVVSKYQPGARWRPRALSPGQALLALLDNAVPARLQPERVLSTLGQVVTRASALKSGRGEAEQIVECLLGRLIA